ncbi:hypothetical protein SAMN02745221_00366 [Thermosyntropha lipolytica DSM 11003]|uniref:Uncharacterized protein n=2 Tax=Thermosyntropha TaxID=54293 RepID=A0A1M5KG48_9FIRM|nr:hypothetical protein SAMN02745221_00366 [Thermosyntropha lipolytica DSM 11003]
MTLALGILAAVILSGYSFYFYKIIIGRPGEFELSLLKSLGEWILARRLRARTDLWLMLLFSAFLELTYFLLAFAVIKNPLLLFFTTFLAGFEFLHLLMLRRRFSLFLKGGLMLKNLFLWPVERISALFLFTHSLLVLLSLIFWQTV